MADSYIIEVSSKTAGIVVRDDGGYRFFSASHDFNGLEGRCFRNARDAERAAIRFEQDRRSEAPQKRGEVAA
jgi:hypothetical protein